MFLCKCYYSSNYAQRECEILCWVEMSAELCNWKEVESCEVSLCLGVQPFLCAVDNIFISREWSGWEEQEKKNLIRLSVGSSCFYAHAC